MCCTLAQPDEYDGMIYVELAMRAVAIITVHTHNAMRIKN